MRNLVLNADERRAVYETTREMFGNLNYGWCDICNHSYTVSQDAAEALRAIKAAICPDCTFWAEKAATADERTAIIGGRHFRVKNELTAALDPNKSVDDMIKSFAKSVANRDRLGMGGRIHVIMFTDERNKVIFTSDLWGQGEVPEEFKHVLPDNAEFLAVQ